MRLRHDEGLTPAAQSADAAAGSTDRQLTLSGDDRPRETRLTDAVLLTLLMAVPNGVELGQSADGTGAGGSAAGGAGPADDAGAATAQAAGLPGLVLPTDGSFIAVGRAPASGAIPRPTASAAASGQVIERQASNGPVIAGHGWGAAGENPVAATVILAPQLATLVAAAGAPGTAPTGLAASPAPSAEVVTAAAAAVSSPQSQTAAATVTQALSVASGMNDTGGASGQGGSLLPAGYLSTSGNQIVDAEGNPVRIASVCWSGTDSLTFSPYGLWQSSLQENIDAIKADGFNTIRVPWTDLLLNASPEDVPGYVSINPALDPELVGATSLQVLDQLVTDAGNDGLKIIFDHHNDDGGPGGWGGQQTNGLWIDSGPGTNGTDGSGTTGTVDEAKFQADSVALAENFAGNSTVIGFDLDNEPTVAGDINWGQGGPTDIQAMYTSVGDAIQAVDPGALIIAEGPEQWDGPTSSMPAGFGEGDLSGVASDPVSLTIPDKVVYSVHEYPPDLSGNGSYDEATQIAEMNAGWGYLETDNIAPVWVGEMGSNLTSSQDSAWIQGILDYMNGLDGAAGGPTFSGDQQPVSGSWWQWGVATGQDPEGVETAWGSADFWPAQQAATDQLLYEPVESQVTSQLGSAAACYAVGTLILTDRGEVAIERLAIGDLVMTHGGGPVPIRWIGRRSYAGPAIAGNLDALPVLFRRGALGGGLPRRNLVVSPRHAMYLDGLLIPAASLVNGVSIVQIAAVERISYCHIELATHDVIFAEGAASESFVDDNSRQLFDNVADYAARYPEAVPTAARYYAPRVETGAAVQRVCRRLVARLRSRTVPAASEGGLRGNLDTVGRERLCGWARGVAAPDVPVRLRVLDNGVAIAELVADEYRPDLESSGIGTGCHGFSLILPGGLSTLSRHVIQVQRVADGQELAGSPWLFDPAAAVMSDLPPHLAPATAQASCGALDVATAQRISGWAQDPADPDVPVALVIEDNGVPLARVLAARFRADLLAAGIGGGRHAFEIAFDGGLSPLIRHVIAVRLERDGSELPGSPMVIEAAVGFDAALEQLLANAVCALETDPERRRVLSLIEAQADRLRLQLSTASVGHRVAA